MAPQEQFTFSEAAELLGVREHRIDYLVRTRGIAVGRRGQARTVTREQLERLRGEGSPAPRGERYHLQRAFLTDAEDREIAAGVTAERRSAIFAHAEARYVRTVNRLREVRHCTELDAVVALQGEWLRRIAHPRDVAHPIRLIDWCE